MHTTLTSNILLGISITCTAVLVRSREMMSVIPYVLLVIHSLMLVVSEVYNGVYNILCLKTYLIIFYHG